MNEQIIRLLVVTGLVGFSAAPAQAGILMATAGQYAVLAGSRVTNTGPSVIDGGHIGIKSTSAITGFLPGRVVLPYTIHSADAVPLEVQNDFATAYKVALDLPFTSDLTEQNLGGLTLDPGVYRFRSSAFLGGTLTLNAHGDPNAQFIFQIGSSFITASNSSVVTINGGPTAGCNVFWQVGGSATLGTDSEFAGHILAHRNITMNNNANILSGSALANDAVTLNDNNIFGCFPEPAMIFLCLMAGVPFMFRRWRS